MRALLTLFAALLLALPALAEQPPDFDPPPETPDPTLAHVQPLGVSILDDDGVLKLVNRDNRITKQYAPQDLVTPKVDTRKKDMEQRVMLRKEAAAALESMFAAALREAGHTLYAASGYRSYGHQQILYNGRVAERGRARAERTVANPGASEHQLGLAMDVQSPNTLNLNQSFGDTQEGKWVADNAHRFGYILRYKAEWTEVTGYAYEPWHIRYVGIAHAGAIHRLNIPLEEYHRRASGLPEYVLRGATDVLLSALLTDGAQIPPALMNAREAPQMAQALREATLPYLPAGQSYEQALWAIYPTPKPTAGPRVDDDQETSLFSGDNHGIAD